MLAVLLLAPLLALTTLAVLAACIALLGPKERRRTAIQLFETVLDGLLYLISAVLRTGRPPRSSRRNRSKGPRR